MGWFILVKRNARKSCTKFVQAERKAKSIWTFPRRRQISTSALVSFWRIWVGKSCGLLTGYWNRRYRLLCSRSRLLSVLYSLLTLWKFLIGHGCVLFVRLVDWAERLQGFLYLSSLENIDYRKLGGDLDRIQYRPMAFKFGWLVLQLKNFYIFIVGLSNREVILWRI